MERRDVIVGGMCYAVGSFAADATTSALSPTSAIEAYERASGGYLGFMARHIVSGRTLSWRAHERFVMCSTYKALLVALVLYRVDCAQEQLNNRIYYRATEVPNISTWHAPIAKRYRDAGFMTVDTMCEAAICYSDNSCANFLMARSGGPAALTAFLRQLDDTMSRIDDIEPEVNRTSLGGVRNTTTPAAILGTLEVLIIGNVLSSSSKARLTRWLQAARGAGGVHAGWSSDG